MVFLNACIYCIILAIVVMLGKRFKKAFVYMLPFVLLTGFINMICTTMFFSEDYKKEPWNVQKHNVLLAEALWFDGDFIFYCVFFIPSMQLYLFVYSPIYILCKGVYLIIRFDIKDTKTSFVYVILYVLIILFVFYVLQLRELARFSE